jgi:ABC-type polysaccharide/polyol phosphate export permease
MTIVDVAAQSKTMTRAWGDLVDGYRRRELWLHLGWQDIKQRYRRSDEDRRAQPAAALLGHRARPLLGAHQELRHWAVVIGLTIVGWVVAAFAMRQYRARVAYWV